MSRRTRNDFQFDFARILIAKPVPTFAEYALFEHDPGRRVVAGAFLSPFAAVDAGLDQARRQRRAQQEMIEPQAGVARPAVSLVIPERVHRFRRMQRADRVAPALAHKLLERGAALG